MLYSLIESLNVQTTFKDGDRVYVLSPIQGKINTLINSEEYEGFPLTLKSDPNKEKTCFTSKGSISKNYEIPSIILATIENYKLLKTIHPLIEFEKP